MKHWSIRTLITVVVVGITSLGIVISFVALASRRASELEQELLNTSATLAHTVSEYCVPSLAFRDQRDAEEALSKLKEFPDVETAGLYDISGALFVSYAREGTEAPPTPPEIERGGDIAEIDGGFVTIQRAVDYDGITYGTLRLRSSAAALAERRREHLFTLTTMAGLLLLLAATIALLVHIIVTKPLQQLSMAAGMVAAGERPPPGWRRFGFGEMGQLSGSLYSMFAQLEGRTKELSESHGRLQALIDASPLGIIGARPSGEVVLWSYEAERIFSISREEALGKAIDEVFPAGEMRDLCHLCVTGEEDLSAAECEWESADGPITLVVSAAAHHGSAPGVRGTIVVVSDVTERRAARDALAHREEQLQRAQKLEAVGRLAAGVAHDFNNLLTVISASASLLRALGPGERELKRIDAIATAAERGAALTRRLLVFGRPKPSSIKPIDLNLIISDLGRIINSVLGESVRLTVEREDHPVLVRADAGQLEQVILNVVLNACDAMPTGGELRIVISHDARGGTIACSDSGCGMDEATIKRAFEPFFTTKPRGTGLGLATSRHILREFGGDIDIASEPGRGTLVTLVLPSAAGAEAEDTMERRFARAQPQPTESVLLVEDEPDVRAAVREILEGIGYAVVNVGRGERALELACNRPFDVLVTDVVMPGMTGPELAREVHRQCPDMPVLYLSGYVGDILEGHGVDPESTYLLQKPFSPEELERTLRGVLSEGS